MEVEAELSVSSVPSGRDAPVQIDAAACRAQLVQMLANPGFDASERDRRFLTYVVEESLAGRADRIKAYSIAVEVFDRDASFDPKSDPIVRVEAGHLRRALDQYYLGKGRADAVVISIPVGGYTPKFDWRNSADTPAPDAHAEDPVSQKTHRPWNLWAPVGLALFAAAVLSVALFALKPQPTQPAIPRLLVQPFTDLSHTDASAAIAQGLTQEVVAQISKFHDIIVIAAENSGNPPVAADRSDAESPRYTLSGSVYLDDTDVRLQARITSKADGVVVWANTYTGDLSVRRVVEIESDIATQVSTVLGQPYGVIFQADASRHLANPPEDWTAYACTLAYYAYRISLDPAQHPTVRKCLESAVARFPNYATAWALLSQTYVDEIRFKFAPDPSEGPATAVRALTAARTAVALDPTNVRGLEAEMFALFFTGDMEAGLRVGRQALAINPNDTELMGEFGYRLALSGNWDDGCPLVEKAQELNVGPSGYYESALAACAYMRGDLTEASMWIRKAPNGPNPLYHLIAAIIFGEAGDPAAATEVEWLRTNAPHFYEHPREELTIRLGRKVDVERVLISLKKAGMPLESD